MSVTPYESQDEYVPIADRPETLLGINITGLLIVWFCVGLRLYTRVRVVRSPGWDDFFVALYLVFTTAGSIALCLGPHFGLGQHIWLVTIPHIISFTKIFYTGNACFITSGALIKASLLLQFRRIFDGKPRAQRLCVALLVLTSLWGLGFGVLAWFPCWPLADFWAFSMDRNCWAFGARDQDVLMMTYSFQSIINMILDWMILAVPIHLYFGREREKCANQNGLIALLLTGAFASIMSIWRVVVIFETQAGFKPQFDPTWLSPETMILAGVENYLSAICGSVPVFWPTIKATLGRVFVTKEVEIRYEDRLESGTYSNSSPNGSNVTLQHIFQGPQPIKYSVRVLGTGEEHEEEHEPPVPLSPQLPSHLRSSLRSG